MTSSPATYRVVVVANETAQDDVLHKIIVRHADRAVPVEVRVVAPAESFRARARREAQARVDDFVARLQLDGINADGAVGDGDPLQAIADVLAEFPADDLIVATHPEGRSYWLEDDLVTRACMRFDLPVVHLVVDVESRNEQLAVAA